MSEQYKYPCVDLLPVSDHTCLSTLNTRKLSWLGQCWQDFVDSFSRPSELKIRQRRDHQGNLRWIVYDPIANQSAQLASEDEVRRWIEQSYQNRFRSSQRPLGGMSEYYRFVHFRF